MTKKLTAVLCVMAMVFTVSCGDKDETTTTTTTASTTTAASGDKIGVAECDEYITKFKACVDGNVPASVKATFEQSFDQATKQWKDLAKTPQGREGLAKGCKMALDSAKQSMASFGCSW